MKTKQKYRLLHQTVLQLGLICAMALPHSASAELLDSIDIKRADGVAVIKITLSRNVRYRRHFPTDKGNIINIYFDDVAIESANRPLPTRPGQALPDTLSRDSQREEHLRSPPSDLVPYFWVAYLRNELRNEAVDPVFEPYYISVQFSQTVNFSLRADEANRAFYIYVPIVQDQNKTNGSAAPAAVKKAKDDVPVTPSPPAEPMPAAVPATSGTPASEHTTGSPP